MSKPCSYRGVILNTFRGRKDKNLCADRIKYTLKYHFSSLRCLLFYLKIACPVHQDFMTTPLHEEMSGLKNQPFLFSVEN